jgi:hypothetical protein
MVAIADGIDFIMDLFRGKSSKHDHSGLRNSLLFCYVTFAFFWMFAWGRVSSLKFSAILTCSSGVQCLGFLLLTVKVRANKSVKGLSSKMLELYALHFYFRLISTCLKNGYVPHDKTGDHIYQFFDIFSLALVMHLLYCVHKSYAHTYQDEHEMASLTKIVAPCFLLAALLHGRNNRSFFFDTCWAFSSNLETVAIVPQLWMMARLGGEVDAVTAHFVGCVVIAGVMSFMFWWFNFQELAKRGARFYSKVLMVEQVLKLVLCADFMYYYTLALLTGTHVVLPSREEAQY